MKRKISGILFGLLFFVGLGILSYPTIADMWNAYRQSRLIVDYDQTVETLDPVSYDEIWEEAREYNRSLWVRGSRFSFSEEEKAEYESVLNISGEGMMGYVEIPVINCTLSIYHGTDEEVLQTSVGHLEGTSLPVGGEGTHCVLSGHRGLPSAKLFSNLDQVKEGDLFFLRVLDETLAYQVDQISTVLPEEVQDLELVAGQDYCTLVTCTPYGVNTHRLLVRGVRTEHAGQEELEALWEEQEVAKPWWLLIPAIGIPALFIWLIVLLVKNRKKG